MAGKAAGAAAYAISPNFARSAAEQVHKAIARVRVSRTSTAPPGSS